MSEMWRDLVLASLTQWQDWWSEGGAGAWFLPPTEEVVESGYCMELCVAGGGGSIADGIGDNGVGWCDSVLVR